MKVSRGVETLELTLNMMGFNTLIYPTLIWDDETTILVDAGLPTSLPEIQKSMDQAGIPLSKLNKVILTHQDMDHIGGLPELMKLTDYRLEVITHEEEKPYIQGDRPLIRMNPEKVAKMMADLPESQRIQMQKMIKEAKPYEKVNVDKTVKDGESLPYCGGITVIHTPGHTPGHICLYLNQIKALITGDELEVRDGQLCGPRPGLSVDEAMAYSSIKKLTQYDIETVICYHGGVYRHNANQRLSEIAKEL